MSAVKTAIEEHYTADEVARRLKLTKGTVLLMLKPGKIWPIAKVNPRVIRIPASSVNRFLQGVTWEARPLCLAGGKRE